MKLYKEVQKDLFKFRIFEEDSKYYVDICRIGRSETGVALHPWDQPLPTFDTCLTEIDSFCSKQLPFVILAG